MGSNRSVYHVVPNANRTLWVVTRESSSHFREVYQSKDQAVAAAQARARIEAPSQVKVHRSGGDMEYEHTYGDDLLPSFA